MVSRVRPLDQLRTTVDFDGADYGLARTVVAVRVAVVISIGVLLAIGPYWVRQHAAVTVAVLAAAMIYAAALMAYPAAGGPAHPVFVAGHRLGLRRSPSRSSR